VSRGATGIVLFAHGARDPAWARPFERAADELRALEPDAIVRLAFLELMAPTLADAAAALVAAGCSRLDVVPLFLGAGGHVRNDLPALCERLRAAHPGVAVTLHPAIGETPQVISAMALAASGLVRERP
jgi:sirohydrochlorin cobaltochelatase